MVWKGGGGKSPASVFREPNESNPSMFLSLRHIPIYVAFTIPYLRIQVCISTRNKDKSVSGLQHFDQALMTDEYGVLMDR
jgi:hypothetical protein